MAQKPTSTSTGKDAKAPTKGPLRARLGLPDAETPSRKMRVNVLAPEPAEGTGATGKVAVKFRHEATTRFATVAAEVRQLCLSDESISSDSIERVKRLLRDTFRSVDQNSRKELLAALVKHVAALQDSGALKRVPSDRVARVVSLVGEAAALVSTPASSDPRKALVENAASLPPMFADRTVDPQGKLPTALQWFEMHWRPLIVEGRSGDDIRQHDFKYYSALASALKRSGRKLSDILPPSPTRSRKGETEEERQTRLRNLNTARVRRHRANKRTPS
ncbi:MAG: hypothetical protein FD160_991 [Caulobacteraceae bacterium]|nr:MAG: hypothetical protein FD160_991 [Caulobacteraceae bacterium]